MKDIKFFSFLSIALTFITLAVLVALGNTDETYTDLVHEWTSSIQSHKSIERKLFYILSFIGIISYYIYTRYCQKKRVSDLFEDFNESKNPILLFGLFFILSVLIKGEANIVFAVLFFICFVIKTYWKDKVDLFLSFILTCYCCFGLFCIYAFLHGHHGLNPLSIFLLSFVILLLLSNKSEVVIRKYNMIAQIFIPALLLSLINSDYAFHEEYYKIKAPAPVRWIVLTIVICYVFNAIHSIKTNWSKPGFDNYITVGTIVSILFFTGFGTNPSAIISNDFHHPFENMIGYSQVFELGQKLYSEYIPVSGMFSVVEGFIHSKLCGGVVSTINISHYFFILVICITIGTLLKYQTSKYVGILLVTLSCFPGYNRIYFILPIMLLLTTKPLLQNSGLWLKLWIITGLVNGLYYPVYGAATCFCFLPLALVQAKDYWTNLSSTNYKSTYFYLGWIATIVPVILCLPLLKGTFIHMMAMGSQTLYADGISRFAQTLPGWFFNYLSEFFTYILMYGFTFVVPSLLVVISFVYCYKQLNKPWLSITNRIPYSFLSVAIMLLISFSYSTVRLDVDQLYNRSGGALYAGLFILIVLALKYYKNRKIFLTLVVLAITTTVSGNYANISNKFIHKLELVKQVPSDFLHINSQNTLEDKKLGTGFINNRLYTWVKYIKERAKQVQNEESYGVLGTFGSYYVYEKPAVSVIETRTVKGFSAAKETADVLRKTKAIALPGASYENYYLYNWMITSGEYIWDPVNEFFVPNKDNKDIHIYNKSIPSAEVQNFGYGPSSFGLSYDSLKDIFTLKTLRYDIVENESGFDLHFSEYVNGEDVDYMYIDFQLDKDDLSYSKYNMGGLIVASKSNPEKFFYKKTLNRDVQVEITYDIQGESSKPKIICAYSKGKILVPLGAGKNWLLNKHLKLSISVKKNNNILLPKLNQVDLLQLRKVN